MHIFSTFIRNLKKKQEAILHVYKHVLYSQKIKELYDGILYSYIKLLLLAILVTRAQIHH